MALDPLRISNPGLIASGLRSTFARAKRPEDEQPALNAYAGQFDALQQQRNTQPTIPEMGFRKAFMDSSPDMRNFTLGRLDNILKQPDHPLYSSAARQLASIKDVTDAPYQAPVGQSKGIVGGLQSAVDTGKKLFVESVIPAVTLSGSRAPDTGEIIVSQKQVSSNPEYYANLNKVGQMKSGDIVFTTPNNRPLTPKDEVLNAAQAYLLARTPAVLSSGNPIIAGAKQGGVFGAVNSFGTGHNEIAPKNIQEQIGKTVGQTVAGAATGAAIGGVAGYGARLLEKGINYVRSPEALTQSGHIQPGADLTVPNSGNSQYTTKLLDKAQQDLRGGKISQKQFDAFATDHFTQTNGRLPTKQELAGYNPDASSPLAAKLKEQYTNQPTLPQGFKANKNGDVVNVKTGKVATARDIESAQAGHQLNNQELLNLDRKGTNPIYDNYTGPLNKTPKTAMAPVEVKNGLLTQAKTAMVESDEPVLATLRKIEKQTGQEGLADKFMYDSGLVTRSNAIANSKLAGNKNLNQALRGLDSKQLGEFNLYAAARSELYNAKNGLKTSAPVADLREIYNNLHGQYGTRFDAMNNFYKDYAKDLYNAGIIDKATLKNFTSNPDYIRTQREMGDLVGVSFGKGQGYSLGSTLASQKRTGSLRDMQPADLTAMEYAQKAQLEIQKNQAATNLIDSLEKGGLAKKLVGADDVAFRREMYKYLKDTKLPPIKKVHEYSDANVRNSLEGVASNLGIDVKRVLNNRGDWAGRSHTGANKIELKAGAPERTMLHEIGHQLDEKFGIQDTVLGAGRSLPERTLGAQIRKATEAGDKELAAGLTKQSLLNKEVRKLAALRYEGKTPSQNFANYTRSSEEKVAVMFEAYLHAPQRFKAVAPNLYKEFTGFLKAHEETAAITRLKPSLVLEKNIVQSRPDNPALSQARQEAYKAALARADLPTRNKNTIKRMVNGIPEVYEVPAEIKQVVDNINPYQLNALTKIVAAPKRIFQATTTGLSAPFAAANYAKDQATAAINSKNVLATHKPSNIFNGLWQASKDFGVNNNDPAWQKFLAHSGDVTQFDLLRNAKNAKQMSRQIRLGETGRVGNMVMSPIRTAEDLVSITEKATRFQNFKGVYDNAIKAGEGETAALQKATLAAWQGTVDFNRFGTWGKTINLLVPYFNSGIQGSRTLARSFATRPVATTAKAMAFVGMPLVGATAWNLSDPERKRVYDNIPEFEKENNIVVIPPGSSGQNEDGTYNVWKLPMPQGYANLVTPARRTMESFANKSPADFQRIAADMIGAISGPINTNSATQTMSSLIPQAVKPLVQQAANKDYFTNKQIVPDYINQATNAAGDPISEPQKTYSYTSGTARMIGNALNQSPIRVEKFLKDTFGKVGQYGLNASDNALATAGVIPKDQIGGVSIPEDVARRFTKTQSIVNENRSSGAKYFDDVKQATGRLNPNEKAAFNTLHPSNTNFLGEDIFDENKRITKYTKAGVYLQFPKVFEADRALDQKQREKGYPGNPLYDLPKDQLTRVLLKATLPPGSKDPELSNLYKQEWYQDYNTKRSDYYNQLKAKLASEGRTMTASDNPYPETPPEVQRTMDYYSSLPKGTGARSAFIRTNPGAFQAMTNQWAAVDAWENKERVAIGLSPIAAADQLSNSSGSSGSSSYKKSYSKTYSPKIKPFYYSQGYKTPRKLGKPAVSVPRKVGAAPIKIVAKKSKA